MKIYLGGETPMAKEAGWSQAVEGWQIGGSKSWDNLKALETMGAAVFPVFHYDDDVRYLKKMIDNYSFIALGGLVGAHRSKLRPWLDNIWQQFLTNSDGTARLKVHGFGLTDFELMARYPWYSIDSSSWLQAGRFGDCVFYEDGKLYKITFSNESNDNGWHYDCLIDPIRTKVDKLLEPHGVTAEQCASHYSFRHLVNAAYQNLESRGTDRLNFL